MKLLLQKILSFTLGAAIIAGLAAACKPARYEIVTQANANDTPANLDPGGGGNAEPKFRVEGPATGKVGTPITVIGIDCGPNNSGKITFIPLGTSMPRKDGPKADFTFDRADTYTIEGTCEVPGKAPQKATIVVKIENPAATGGGNGQNQNQNGQNQSQN